MVSDNSENIVNVICIPKTYIINSQYNYTFNVYTIYFIDRVLTVQKSKLNTRIIHLTECMECTLKLGSIFHITNTKNIYRFRYDT